MAHLNSRISSMAEVPGDAQHHWDLLKMAQENIGSSLIVRVLQWLMVNNGIIMVLSWLMVLIMVLYIYIHNGHGL